MKRKISGIFAGKSRVVVKIMKVLLACIAVANLIWLFLFNYGLTDLPSSAEPEFPETAYLYEESETLAEHTTASVQSVSEKTQPVSEKPEPSSNSVSSTNANYEGPVISLPEELPQINQSDLTRLVHVLSDQGLLAAEDGFGNDITSSVKVSYKADPENAQMLLVKFSVTNSRGDSASEETSIPVKLSKPLLFLTKSSVTIEQGDDFNSLLYIQTAVDQDGSSLSDSVIVTGEVDTSVPGTYILTYTINSKIEKQSSASETLTVTVK